MKIVAIQLCIILFQLILIGFQFYEPYSWGVTFGVCCLLIILFMLNTIREQPQKQEQK